VLAITRCAVAHPPGRCSPAAGDFEEVLAALVGKDAPGLSASTIARLKEVWTKEHARWQKRDMSAKRYVYCWADGIHLEARLEQ
jgi:putative transposase